MTTWSIFTGAGAPVLSPPASPPVTSTTFGNPIVIGAGFQATAGSIYLAGYRYWVADTAGNHGPQKFALWQANSGALTYAAVPAGTVTSGALVTGAWNTVLLAEPVPLTQDANYLALTGMTGNFNFTSGFWTTGGAGAAGLANGPLHLWSDASGTDSDPYNNPQDAFSASGTADPSVTTPAGGDSAFNGWVDIVLTDAGPASPTYRIWPSLPVAENPFGSASDSAVVATQVTVSAAAVVANLWHYSPPNATALPTRCGIWAVAGQSAIADVTSPSWSGAAGSGWVSCSNFPAGVILSAGAQYKAATFRDASGDVWFQAYAGYWTTGPGSAGRSNGILTAPASAGTAQGQGSFNESAWAYPATTDAEGYWVDLEVSPAPSGLPAGGLPLAAYLTPC